ncbi:F-box protein FBW2-like [Bidens hawaiensis]|uniref:F-box protein FBW2-like n=1 Tax=Bidens hawaiensis TaxID=980011 RepID=UPI00404A20FD
MSKKVVDYSEVERRRWDGLNPEILARIFVKILPVEEMVSRVPFVCKGWREVVAGPYCWMEVDLQPWAQRRNDSHVVDQVVKKVVRMSKFTVQRLSAYRLGESGFFSVAHCGRFLKVLKMPMSDITDQMVLKHLKLLPNLKVLDVSYCVKITSKGLEAFGHQCKSLLRLKRNMQACDAYLSADESEAKAIAETMPNLHHIELCFGRFGDSGVSEILTKCKAVTHLDIQGSWNVELNGDLAEICERLEHFQSPWNMDDGNRLSDMSECSDVDVTYSD